MLNVKHSYEKPTNFLPTVVGGSRVRDTGGGNHQPEEIGGGVRGGVGAGESHPESAPTSGRQLVPAEDDHHIQPERTVVRSPHRRHNQVGASHAHQTVQRQGLCFYG